MLPRLKRQIALSIGSQVPCTVAIAEVATW